MQKLKIMIASPVRRRPEILNVFLQGLEELERNGHEFIYRFIDDNDDPVSSGLMRDFAAIQNRKGISAKIEQADRAAEILFHCDETTHCWDEVLVWRVAEFKDRFIQQARDERADGLFLLDSDVVVHPETVIRLLETEKEIVSEVFWTQWQSGSFPMPQVWMNDEYDMADRNPGEKLSGTEAREKANAFLAKLRIPGVYPVGGLGACTLIGKEALQAGVSFRKIRNLSLWGEDRHFCIRAICLGFELFVDTTLPALHVYRLSDLDKLPSQRIHWRNMSGGAATEVRPKLLLSMIVRDEVRNDLREMLEHCREYIGAASIIDDGSRDGSADICREVLAGIPLTIVRNDESRFTRENELRKQQWMEAARLNPEWMLVLDADEWFESSFREGLSSMMEQEEIDVFSFRIYDFWDSEHYREDAHWRSHLLHRPLLVRYRPHFPLAWLETPLHCGRMPSNIFTLPNALSSYRLKHMGWSRQSNRRLKYESYMRRDPDGKFGSKAQYESILEPDPRVVKWME